MTCDIIPPSAVKLNGTNGAYGGKLTSLSLNFGPIGSEQKASVTLVGRSMSTPGEGDDMTVTIANSTYKMRVGGYTMTSSAAGATTMSLDLRDTSAKFLDNDFVLLGEESGTAIGTTPNNITIAGKKFGPIPDLNFKKNQIYTANRDTEWGDIRAFYEANSFERVDENVETYQARLDSLIRSNPGKVLYEVKVGGEGFPIPNSLLKSGVPFAGFFDFKGSFRDVIVAYCNATGAVAWWDMDEEKVDIQAKKNTEQGLAKLNGIKRSCEIVSAAKSVDYTTTLAQSAQGSVSLSFPGENASWGGLKMSRFLAATALRPEFKYKNCKDKNKEGGLIELSLSDTNVLKAFQASVDPKIYAAYALQSTLGNNAHTDTITHLEAKITTKENTKKNQKAGKPIAWGSLLPEGLGNPFGDVNTFLKDYYEYDKERPCSNGYSTVQLGDGKDFKLGKHALAMAEVGKITVGDIEETDTNNAKTPTGWNENKSSDPFKTMGEFSLFGAGKYDFDSGMIIAGLPGYLDSVVGEKGLEGGNDILRMYLMAIYKFYNRFWVIRANGIDPRTNYRSPAFSFKGKDYGYYLTSSATGSNISLTPPEGYKLVSVNPLASLGTCGVPELQALAQALALMYLPPGKSLQSVMGRAEDADSPVEGVGEEEQGAAVIDFIYALDSDSQAPKSDAFVGKEAPSPPSRGLEVFFQGTQAGGETQDPIRRGEDSENPEIMMHLLVLDSPASDLSSTPQISFLANDAQREGDNKGEFQGEAMMNGPAKKYAESAMTDLSAVKSLAPLKGANKDDLRFFGLQAFSLPDKELLNLHTTVPPGYVKLNGADLFEGTTFIPPAVLTAPGDNKVKVWYNVEGSVNSWDESAADIQLSGFTAPAGNCWTSKMEFGLSINAADIGTNNGLNQAWEALPERPADKYSKINKSEMTRELIKRLELAESVDRSFGVSESLTYLVNDTSNGFSLPSIADGVESLAVSVTGTRIEVSIAVGGKAFSQGVKSMVGRSVQTPTAQYRPSSLVPDAFTESVNPRFTQAMRNS